MTPAPSSLLQIISCKCTKNCGAACGCRRAGLKCSIICSNCSGQTCDNVPHTLDYIDDNIEEDDIDLPRADVDEAGESDVEDDECLSSSKRRKIIS